MTWPAWLSAPEAALLGVLCGLFVGLLIGLWLIERINIETRR